jgi:regulator of ribonuclease activity A
MNHSPYARHVTSTADVLDEHPVEARVCEIALQQFGGLTAFSGPISTVRCHEDNVVLKRQLGEPGEGRVLVVDGGGSRRVALLGDMVAGLAAGNGWAGVIVNGCVRDSVALRALDVGIKALGTNPRPSGKAGAGEIDVPVEFGGVTFLPGAMLYSDDDGVVVVDLG